jgi:Fe-S-cluster containining protein
VFLTLGDIRRIGERGAPDPFYAFVPVAAGGGAGGDRVWNRIFTHPLGLRVVARRPGGDCVFLDHDGCRLDMETRPLICRLYPFEYDAVCIKGTTPHLCPRPEQDNAPLLLALLGMNRKEAEIWRAALYREIVEEYPDDPGE